MKAGEEVIKEVNKNEDRDAVSDLSNLNGTEEETLSSYDLNDEKGSNESSLILSSPQGFGLEQEETESKLQHGMSPATRN